MHFSSFLQNAIKFNIHQCQLSSFHLFTQQIVACKAAKTGSVTKLLLDNQLFSDVPKFVAKERLLYSSVSADVDKRTFSLNKRKQKKEKN